MKRLLRNHIYPVDWIVIGYCCLSIALIFILGRPFGQYVDELVFYTVMALIATAIIRFIPEEGHWLQRFVRLLYPALMFTFFYRETGGLMFLVHGQFFDPQLTAFEQSVLGVEPSLWLDRNLLNVWLNEVLMACYFSYYFMLPGLLLPLFLLKRDRVIRQALAAISLTFFVSYMLFFLYPIEGPRWHFMDQYLHSIDGPFFRQMVNFMIAKGAVRGGCMPSTHVAVGLVILIFAFRQSRKWGWIMLPVLTGLAIATVWGRFHYLSDVVVGAAIASVVTFLVLKFYSHFEPAPLTEPARSREKVENVS